MGYEQGLSGLNAASQNLSVIGNNIANASTYGDKSSTSQFSDMYASALSDNSSVDSQIGIGAQVSSVSQNFTQGDIDVTGNSLDLAINGGGFFQLKSATGQTVYSRDGEFQQNSSGGIVNSAGQQLLGYPASNGVVQSGVIQPLTIPTTGISAQATTTMSMTFNLDSTDAATDGTTATTAGTTGINLDDPTTYNNATSMTVYDAKGEPVTVTAYFQKSGTTDPNNGDDVWNVYLTANGTPIQTDVDGNTISLDSNGNPTTPYTTMEFPATGGSPDSTIADYSDLPLYIPASTSSSGSTTLSIPYDDPLNPSSTLTPITLNLGGATENASAFAVTAANQNGYAPGSLTGVQMQTDGTVQAQYSNGQTQAVGQVVLANFQNVQGLAPQSGNVWTATVASGQPVTGIAGTGSLGALQTGSLEESNVDLTSQLVDLITAQNVYQANAQTIKTEDQVMQTVVNLQQ